MAGFVVAGGIYYPGWYPIVSPSSPFASPVSLSPDGLYKNAILARGAVAYYRMGDASGNLTDSSGNNVSLIAANGPALYHQPQLVRGDGDTAIITASNSFWQAGNLNAALTGDMSIVVWVKIVGGAVWALTNYEASNIAAPWTLQVQADNTLRFARGNGVSETAAVSTFAATGVHMLGVTQVGTTVRFYLDGVNQGTTSTINQATDVNNTFGLAVGRNPGFGQFSNGASIDELSIFSGALSDADMALLYKLGTVVVPAPQATTRRDWDNWQEFQRYDWYVRGRTTPYFLPDPIPVYASPPTIPVVSKAVPSFDVELAITSAIAHVFTIGTSTLDGSDVLGGGTTPVFQNVTSDVMQFSVKRGRTANLDTIMQGTAQLTLADSTGKYNPQGGYFNAVLTDQPSGYWRLNEISGTAIGDSSGRGNLGTLTGTVAYGQAGSTADGDTAMKFDGATSHIATTFTGDPSQSDMAIELWFKPASITAQNNLIAQQDGSGTGRQWLSTAASTGQLQTSAGGINTLLGFNLVVGTNYHIVLRKIGTSLLVYVNDALIISLTKTIESATGNWVIAANKTLTANFANGTIDEVAIYQWAPSTTRFEAHTTAALLYGSGVQPMLPVKINATFYDYITSVLNDAPTAWYRFSDAITSTVATDSSGANNTGTLHGGVRMQQQGIIVDSSPAAKFDGSQSYIQIPWSANLGFTSALSVEFWIKLDTLAAGGIAGQRVDGSNFWSITTVIDGYTNTTLLKWTICVAGVSYTQYSGPLSAGQWYNVMAVFDGSQISLWINNTQYGPTAAVTRLALTNSTMYIGQDGTSNYLAMTLDEYSVYPFAAGSTRVAAHFNSGVGIGGDTRVFNLFYGFIDRIEYSPDAANQTTLVTCVDFFEQLNIVTPTIATQYNQRSDQLIKTILSVVPLTDPNFISLQTGPDNIVAWGDGVTGSNTALQLIQNLMLPDQGLLHINGAGAVTYKNRSTRYGIPVPVAIWDGAMLGPGSKPSADKRLLFNYESATREFSQQTVNTSGSPTGGTFTLTLDGQTTSSLNFNATAGQIQTALQALTQVGSSGVTCTGGPIGTNPVICNFIGYRVNIVIGANSLTGGTSPTVSISNSIASSTAQVAQDATSQKQFGLRAFSGVGTGSDASTNWTNDSQANSFANFIVLVNKGSRPPLRNATIQNGPSVNGSNEAPRRLWQMLGRDITDPVLIDLSQAPYGGGSFSSGTVQSTQLDVSAGGTMITGQYTVQPTSVSTLGGLFTLGFSKLDSADVVGY